MKLTNEEILIAAEIIQQADNGARLQNKYRPLRKNDQWSDCTSIGLNFDDFFYRVKPEEKKPREVWLTEDEIEQFSSDTRKRHGVHVYHVFREVD